MAIPSSTPTPSAAAPRKPLISFWAPCEPPVTTAQQKGVVVINGKPHFFQKKKVARAANILTWALKRWRPAQPLDQPLSVRMVIVYPWPKSVPKHLRATIQPHAKCRPDVDNAFKLIGDVMTDLGYWRDDGLIYDLHVTKLIGPNTGIGVRIYPGELAFDPGAWI